MTTQREGVQALEASGALDDLYAKIDAGEVRLEGKDGLIQQLIKAGLERGLRAELTEHVGYEEGDPEASLYPSSQNGSFLKTVATSVGDVDLAIPRDRDGSFTPVLVPKGSRRVGGLDDMIVSLYAGGMTTWKPSLPLPVPVPPLVPANKLNGLERARILDVVNSPDYVDLPPIQIYARLLDRGVYLASISTIYRVLAENKQVKERRRLARHPARAIPELAATGPGQVYSWDITKLAGPIKGTWFDCYAMIDIFSRYIVGAHVHASESGELAVEMMKEIFGIHGTPHVVHADRGTSMTSKTVAALLSDLEVTKSHSRPHVSNDNSFSEAWVQDPQVRPGVPGTLQVRGRGAGVHGRLRRRLQPHSPAHRNRSEYPRRRPLRPRRRQGHRTVSDPGRGARTEPERFSTTRDPKILTLHDTVWINKPVDPEDGKHEMKLAA